MEEIIMHNPSTNELMALIGDLEIQIEDARVRKEDAKKKLLNRLGLDKLEEFHWKAYEEGLDAALISVKNTLQPSDQELQNIRNARK